jgi:hypothetical protein
MVFFQFNFDIKTRLHLFMDSEGESVDTQVLLVLQEYTVFSLESQV